ncbi:MAG: stage IV sporulation protein A [Clostridia bacterium]|nr:stage IV sporulation protein A [Clostridia bacterium]
MTNRNIYNSIATRTGGDIYIGVVGPVRTGKSTLIKRLMDVAVLPNLKNEAVKARAMDELPQSSAGRTIMTTEPKFIPENGVELEIGDCTRFSLRLIDCVGYIVPGAIGYIENNQPRMVRTPWFEKEIPFNMAAEIGTKKVIAEHSTIGLVVTTDGTIGDIARDDYTEAECRVIDELRQAGKPFVVLLNSKTPDSAECAALAESLSEKYAVTVLPVNCRSLTAEKTEEILAAVLHEFPIKEIQLDFPHWINRLDKGHEIRKELFSAVREASAGLSRIKDAENFASALRGKKWVSDCRIDSIDLSCGCVRVKLTPPSDAFYKVLSEKTGTPISDEQQLMDILMELTSVKKEYGRFREALDEVEKTGYGIVMPTMEELSLEDPEIMKQGGRYGVRLKASAPSIHMLKANITTEVAPIVGTESQSEELIMYLLKEFEEDPSKIWESNIFGKTLNSLVNEGLHNKLYKMPSDARMKLQETLERVINEGCSGLICIIL